jgi:uncharacterized Zn finger protein (UPF0148 family)
VRVLIEQVGATMTATETCPKCREEISAGAKVCPSCRYRLRFDLEHAMKVAGWVMVAVLVAMIAGYYTIWSH